MKKPLIILVVIAVVGVIAYSQRADIAMRLMSAGAKSAMTESTVDGMEDGLHVTLCGAGGPLPDPKR